MSGDPSGGLDLADVPRVAAEHLAIAFSALIEAERALMLINGPSHGDRAEIEAVFWRNFEGDTGAGVAALLRFWSLVDAFQSRRMRTLLMQRGYQVLWPAAKAAAALRLNLYWGFNPQHLIWAIGPAQPAIASLPVSRPSDASEQARMAA